MRLQAEQIEEAMDTAFGHAGLGGEAPDAPVRGVLGLLPEHLVEQTGDPIIIMRPGPTGTLFAIEPHQTVRLKSRAPVRHCRHRHPEALGNGGVGLAFCREQNHLRAAHHAMRHRPRLSDFLQRDTLVGSQLNLKLLGTSFGHAENDVRPL